MDNRPEKFSKPKKRIVIVFLAAFVAAIGCTDLYGRTMQTKNDMQIISQIDGVRTIFSFFDMLRGIFLPAGETLSDESEVVLKIKEQLPDAVYIGREGNGDQYKHGGYYTYTFRNHDIEFTVTEKNERGGFFVPEDYVNRCIDDYREKLLQKVNEEYLLKHSELLRNSVIRFEEEKSYRHVTFSVPIDSIDEIDHALDVFEKIYDLYEEYLPEFTVNRGDIGVDSPKLRFGCFCPTDNVYEHDIFTYPSYDKYGYIEYTICAAKDTPFSRDEAAQELRRRYIASAEKGYISDHDYPPVATPDEDIFYNNHYLTRIVVDGEEIDTGFGEDHLFYYSDDEETFLAPINDSWSKDAGLSADEHLLYGLYTALYPDGKMEAGGNYGYLTWTIGSDNYLLSDRGEKTENGTYFKLHFKINDTVQDLETHYAGYKRYDSELYVDPDGLAELLGLSLDRIDDENKTIYYTTN